MSEVVTEDTDELEPTAASEPPVAAVPDHLRWVCEQIWRQLDRVSESTQALERKALGALTVYAAVTVFAVERSSGWEVAPRIGTYVAAALGLLIASWCALLVVNVRFRMVTSERTFWDEGQREWIERHRLENAALALQQELIAQRRESTRMGRRAYAAQMASAIGIVALLAVMLWGEAMR